MSDMQEQIQDHIEWLRHNTAPLNLGHPMPPAYMARVIALIDAIEETR